MRPLHESRDPVNQVEEARDEHKLVELRVAAPAPVEDHEHDEHGEEVVGIPEPLELGGPPIGDSRDDGDEDHRPQNASGEDLVVAERATSVRRPTVARQPRVEAGGRAEVARDHQLEDAMYGAENEDELAEHAVKEDGLVRDGGLCFRTSAVSQRVTGTNVRAMSTQSIIPGPRARKAMGYGTAWFGSPDKYSHRMPKQHTTMLILTMYRMTWYRSPFTSIQISNAWRRRKSLAGSRMDLGLIQVVDRRSSSD